MIHVRLAYCLQRPSLRKQPSLSRSSAHPTPSLSHDALFHLDWRVYKLIRRECVTILFYRHFEMRAIILLCVVSFVAAQRGFFQTPGRQRFQPRQNSFGGSSAPVHDRNGRKEYHYSWRGNGGSQLTGQGAASYCRGLGPGWSAVNINNGNENSYVYRVIQGERLDYIWTGGFRSGRGWSWADGSGFGFADWSHTGGARRAQPDNREGNEVCLAILNNFYGDGVKWHDVACSHRKPVICERG
ncbi:C-type lectin-like [Trinorchestia longiramus]|nr:C-type lectin-like [Trinorchestia longiramus]